MEFPIRLFLTFVCCCHASQEFEALKRDASQIITKANPTTWEKFAIWIRRQRSEQALGEADSLVCCGNKSIEIIDLAGDAIFLLQCVYLAVVLTEGAEVTAAISEEAPRVLWCLLMVLPGEFREVAAAVWPPLTTTSQLTGHPRATCAAP